MNILKSKRIYFEDGVKDGYLVLQNGKIVGFLSADSRVKDYVDYGNNRIIPGIFDTHNHGTHGFGLDTKYPSEEEIKDAVRGYLKALTYEGVTSVFPTITDNIKEVADISIAHDYIGANVLGIHSEGPYLNRVGEKGRPEPHPDVDMNFVHKMYEDSRGLLRLVAMAPEIPGTDAAKDYFLSKGVTIAFAHSDCKMEEARRAIDAGYRVSTHTSNVMVGIHHRDIGGLGVMLDDPRVQCEIICDGLHNCLEWISLMLKIKPHEQFMMISDSATMAGYPVGRYDAGWVTPENITEDGFLVDDDGRLQGSTKSVLYGISNLVEKLHMPLEEVIKLSSLNAANYYGFGDTKGSIKIGKDGDVVVISDDYKALATYVMGEKIFDREKDEILYNTNTPIKKIA